LDVQEIAFYGKKLNQTSDLTTCVAIENAMHGVTLSTPNVRAKAYNEIFRWLNITN
jgi:alpha-beta hydrolase superfamily lysophospholipase